jgi:DmsE family decaheme c-type cytochrome
MLSTVVLVVLVGLAVGAAAAGDDTDELCATCHDELAAAFKLTPHAIGRPDAPSCTSCHGNGEQHMEDGDPSLIEIPAGSAGAATCTTCHGGIHSALEEGRAHATVGIHCESCHQVHAKPSAVPALLRATPNELCGECHQRQVRSFNRPFGHELGRGGLDCISCHNPHGGSGERSLKHDRSGEAVCVTCHSDKRGPFVFPHVTGPVGDCLTCHQPHGSSNPHALTRSRVDQLCLECHSTLGGSTLGSQPPSFHDLRSPRYRECTVCHVTVHGSNTSPALVK